MLANDTLQFLTQLKKNNNKVWFDAHRAAYEHAKENFIELVQNIIKQLSLKDDAIKSISAKDCLFRINRDVRFSKDKSPYKTNMGAYINAQGKKSITAGYYIHIEPGISFCGGGMWQPMPEQLQKVRQEIDYNFNDFKKIISHKNFIASFGHLSSEDGQVLTRVPKGFEANSPAAEYLKFKSYVAIHHLKDNELTTQQACANITKQLTHLYPLIQFLNTSLI